MLAASASTLLSGLVAVTLLAGLGTLAGRSLTPIPRSGDLRVVRVDARGAEVDAPATQTPGRGNADAPTEPAPTRAEPGGPGEGGRPVDDPGSVPADATSPAENVAPAVGVGIEARTPLLSVDLPVGLGRAGGPTRSVEVDLGVVSATVEVSEDPVGDLLCGLLGC